MRWIKPCCNICIAKYRGPKLGLHIRHKCHKPNCNTCALLTFLHALLHHSSYAAASAFFASTVGGVTRVTFLALTVTLFGSIIP